MRYRHIIWDWNGTLLDDLALTIDIMNGILRQEGLPAMDQKRYHAVFDFPVRNYYAAVGLDTTDENFHRLSALFISEYDRRRWDTQLHPGAAAILEAVQSQGATQSILSAYRHETLCEIVRHFGLTDRFVQLCGLDNIYAHSKAELGRHSLQQLGVDPRSVIMVGDTLHDFDVAESIGVDCVLVAHGHHPLDRLAARCDRVVQDLPELRRQLDI